MQEVKNIFVLGSGLMGHGIVQVAAQAGYAVVMRDLSEELVQKGLVAIDKSLQRSVDKGKLSVEEKNAVLKSIVTTTSLDQVKDADLVIEAATEKPEVKEAIFRELDAICWPDTLFASNTSSISITRLAAVTKRADKFIGMHFFNPVQLMPVVELIKGLTTSDDTVAMAEQVVRKLGKETILAKDYPAFLLNRILLPMINEAIYCVMEGQGTAEDIDKGMKMAMGHPMGPLKLADFIGLDTLLSVFEVMYEGYGNTKYFPCPLLRRMVQAGQYGVKSGKGFYDYSKK